MAVWNPEANEIFAQTIEIEDPAAREEFIRQQCGDNQELLEIVQALVKANSLAGSFLDSPLDGVTQTIDSDAGDAQQSDGNEFDKIGEFVGPYKLTQKLGEGGMGVVYLAEQLEPVQRRVALKIIKPGMDSESVIARFEAERQALALMNHPNIARVFDAGTSEQGRPYFVMELVKGIPITQYADQQHLTPEDRLKLFIDVCHATDHAHQKGIVHRDIKPSNVLVAEIDGHPVPKVIDFGVAKAINQRLTEKTMVTQFGQFVGTFEYMSPEQAGVDQLDIDVRSDIYSLGVLLYELLIGVTPFEESRLRSAAFDELLRIIREEEPEKPSSKLSTVDGLPSIAANRSVEPRKLSSLMKRELDWIVMKALEKDRNRRYEDASGFAKDIKNFLEGEPVNARPPSIQYRLSKFARRNRAALANVIVLIVAVSIVATVLLWRGGDSNATDPGLTGTNLQRLENGFTISQDGRGEFKSIIKALSQASPGMVLDIIDDGVYDEQVVLDDPEKYKNVTLRSSGGATLKVTSNGGPAISLHDVQGVTLEGFKVADDHNLTIIHPAILVSGSVSGCSLRSLEINLSGSSVGVVLKNTNIDKTGGSILISKCRINGGGRGIDVINGRGVRIEHNRLDRQLEGVQVMKRIQEILIASNLITNCRYAGLDLEEITPDSRDIIVANNTITECESLIRIADKVPGRKHRKAQVSFLRNLLFSPRLVDVVHLVRGRPIVPSPIAQLWVFEENFRQPNKGSEHTTAIELSASDREIEKLDFVSMVPDDEDYLRPKPNAPFADLPERISGWSLPRYAGAIPPKHGDSVWDWNEVWEDTVKPVEPVDGLTVSKQGNGQYTTIQDALSAARPGNNKIVVLDSSIYEETIRISDSERLEGITITTKAGATLKVPEQASWLLRIDNVAGVTIDGFNIRDRQVNSLHPLINITGKVGETLLTNLSFEQTESSVGIHVKNTDAGTGPITIHSCRFEGGGRAVDLTNVQHVRVIRNRIADQAEGIQLRGNSRDCMIAGNIVATCKLSAIKVHDLGVQTGEILIANNTVHESGVLIRISDDPPYVDFPKNALTIINNILFDPQAADILCIEDKDPAKTSRLMDRVRVEHNWRKRGGDNDADAVPLSKTDHALKVLDFQSQHRDDPGYLRPNKRADFAKNDLGVLRLPLPSFAGARAPEGDNDEWSWDETGKALHKLRSKAHYNHKTAPR